GTRTKPESDAPHLGEDYFQIFREEKSMRVALERASHVYGPQMDGQPLFLDSLSRISVVNPQGDAQVLATMTCANIGRERLYDIPQLFWFEFPREHLDLRVYDAETHEPIPWRFTTDSPHKKVGFASIPGGIEPLTTRRLTFEYFAPEMFRFSSFYFTRIKPGLLEKSFHISILREEPLKDAFAYRLRPDDSVAPERPFVIVQRKKDRADIRWTIHYPEPKSLVKTFWAY
ncbi:MAG: hypothetical protein IT290_10080, partial [Deltaproteobacteria bacterium]|nr:hypothetical protein [Deltaproteobacteria bacterium]